MESRYARLHEISDYPETRRTAQVLFEELQSQGYEGGYDSVRRHVQAWRRKHRSVQQVYIPLSFDPGEAFQFDWSHEKILLDGMPATVKVAHIRLCHSRFFLVVAYPRETQEMVFGAHIHAFKLFGGSLNAAPLYGIAAVREACAQALSEQTISKDVVLNILNRSQDDEIEIGIDLPEHLILKQNPVADCQRYEVLMKEACHVAHR